MKRILLLAALLSFACGGVVRSVTCVPSPFPSLSRDGDDRRVLLLVKSDSLSSLADYNDSLGNYQEAIRLETKAMEIRKEVLGEKDPDYARSLNNLVYYNGALGNYQEAIRLGTMVSGILKEALGENHPYYATSLSNLAVYYSGLGNYRDAICLETEAMEIRKEVLGEKDPDYTQSLNNLALYHFYLGNYQEAIRLGTKALAIRKEVLGEQHPNYAISSSNLALYNSALGDYQEAIRLGTKALEILKDALGEKDPYYATSLSNLAGYYSKLGNYQEAIRLETMAMAIRKEALGEKHSEYARSFNYLATYNYALGNYQEAIRLETKALAIRKEVLGEQHPDYAISLSNLALYNSALGNNQEAIHLGTRVLEIQREALGENHLDYARSLSNLALYYSNLGNYQEAIRLGTKAMTIRKEVLGENHPDYATSLSNLALCYSDLGNYPEAIRLATRALEIQQEILGENHPYYARSLNNLAYCHSALGNYPEAILLGTRALEILKEALGENHPDYATSLNNLAYCYSVLGNYQEAIRLGTMTLEISKEVLGENHPDYARSLNNLAYYNSTMDNCPEAIRLETMASGIWKEVLGEKHPDYARSLNNLAYCHFALGNYQEAIRLGTMASGIWKEALGENHPDYARSLNNLTTYNFYLGNNQEAIRLGTMASGILKETLGEEHPDYATSLSNLAYCHFKLGNKQEAAQLYTKVTDILINLVLSTFVDLTTSERASFWDKYYAYFNDELPQRAYALADDSLYISAYNGVLLSKGLLLNAEIEMRKLLQESGDTAIMTLYDETRMNKEILGVQMQKPVAERTLDVDSLQRLIKGQEQELVRRSKVYGDYMRNLSIDWKDVQRKLGGDDVAVEFLSFHAGGDSLMYVAMVVKPGMARPEMIPLFEQKQLKDIPAESYYSSADLFRLVWKPLEGELDGVKDIYFSPSGELYNIAIEVLPDADGTRISDRFNLYRLSSTRQLALVTPTYDSRDMRIYGGLKYDTDLSQLIRDYRKYVGHSDRMAQSRSFEDSFIADSLHMRSGAEELPGTRIEVENIKRSLDAAHIENELYTDSMGTETSFKDMSGRRFRALHIATHGFYWTESEARQLKNLDFLMLGDNQSPRYTEDKALTRSGLLMAGANNALMGLELPEEVDNGILTAKEIAGLDLRGMDMVVLSACQTGLGEITGDGVFGLQRGFKKAGVNSLLMSLWKVDDKATQMLMTQFYANLIAGMGKHDALREAQHVLREYEEEQVVVLNEPTPSQKRQLERQGKSWEPQTTVRKVHPYAHPRYWAAFILLDGI